MSRYSLYILTAVLLILLFVSIGLVGGKLILGSEFDSWMEALWPFVLIRSPVFGILAFFAGIGQVRYYAILVRIKLDWTAPLKALYAMLCGWIIVIVITWHMESIAEDFLDTCRIVVVLGTPVLIGSVIFFLFTVLGEILFRAGFYNYRFPIRFFPPPQRKVASVNPQSEVGIPVRVLRIMLALIVFFVAILFAGKLIYSVWAANLMKNEGIRGSGTITEKYGVPGQAGTLYGIEYDYVVSLAGRAWKFHRSSDISAAAAQGMDRGRTVSIIYAASRPGLACIEAECGLLNYDYLAGWGAMFLGVPSLLVLLWTFLLDKPRKISED